MKRNGQLEAEVQELKRTSKALKRALCRLMHAKGYGVDAIAKEMRVPKSTAWRWISWYDEKKMAERHAARQVVGVNR
jgi:transposase